MIKIRNLVKSYKSGTTIVNALDNINLELDKKGLVCILGESGSGKSTLLNIIGCLDNFDSGYVTIDNYNIAAFSSKQKGQFRASKISFVFQELNLINELNAYENIQISLNLLGIKDEKRIYEVAKYLDIEDLLDKKVVNLSRGEKQRIAIARSIIKKPRVILADEPTGSLDLINSENIMKLFKKISKDTLVIIVSHNEELANKYASRVIKLSDGKIIFDNKKQKKKNEDIISSNVIKVNKDCNQDTLNYLNKAISSYNKDVYLSIESNKQLNYALFKDDIDRGVNKENDIKYDECINDVKFEKVKYEFKDIFKITIANFLSRWRYMLLTISLILLSFISYIASCGLSSFNKNNAYIETIEKENIKNINFVYFDNDTTYKRINNEMITSINKYENIKYNKQYLLNYKLLLNKTVNGSKYLTISGISEIESFSSYNYTFVKGDGNFTNYNQIVIEEDFANALLEGEYFKDTVIGNKLVIHDNEYEIIGIISDNSLLKDTVRNKDITSRMIFVKKGFMDVFYNDIDVYKDNYIISNETNDYYASIVFEDYIHNENLEYYFDEGKSKVDSNDILVSENLYHTIDDKKQIELTISSINENLYKGTFNIIGYYTYNGLDDVDNTNINSIYNDSILLSNDYKSSIGENIYYTYQILIGLTNDSDYNKSVIEDMISKGLVISNDFIEEYESYSSNIETISSYLNLASVIFLIISLVLIATYIKNNIDENSRVSGILNALGFSKISIMCISLFEHLIIIIVGFILSILMSLLLMPFVNMIISKNMGFYFSSYTITFASLLTIFGVSMIMILLSLVYSLLKNNSETVDLINNRNIAK